MILCDKDTKVTTEPEIAVHSLKDKIYWVGY